MPPAARVTDVHACPASEGPKPHVGGPIIPPCCTTVKIGELFAARVNDQCTCVGPTDTITQGSTTVKIGDQFAARQLDPTAHGGKITGPCCTTVIIGD